MISTVWQPKFTITPSIARWLMEIEAAKTAIDHTPLPLAAEAELRQRARIRSTHYSTRIEGNRLTLAEAEEVIREKTTRFQGRERDVREVRNYWRALLQVEEWAVNKTPLTEELIRKLHAMVAKGKRAKPSPYRDGQNVIRDSASGAIVYMPPEAKDISNLMPALINWIERVERDHLPTPIIAGLAHYQFVTIHPYYDGNGRTARLLATFILHRGGYGLNGYYSLEEHHARDLAAYYRSLALHPHHNYYEGRATVDLTPWLEYFIKTLADVFTEAKQQTGQYQKTSLKPDVLQQLDHRTRLVLTLFVNQSHIRTADVAHILGLSDRMARVLINQWVESGMLVIANASRRKRAYTLSAKYRQFIGNASAIATIGD